MAADIKKNDDFSKGPISKTVLRLAVPMVLAQFVNVLYNIVDRMYIGHISDTSVDALTGVGVTFPILLMVTAFANLFGTGGTPLFSMARGAAQQGGEEGEKQRERAADVMNNTFSMLVITGVILCMVVLLIKKPVLYLFGASDATYPYADSYLSVYMLGSVFMMVSLGISGFIMGFTSSAVQVACNAMLSQHGGDLFVAVMTVINSIREVTYTPVNGVTSAAAPVVSFNYGAQKYKRVRGVIVFTTVVSFSYMVLVWLVLRLFPHVFIQLFNGDPQLLETCTHAMHIYFFGCFMMALQMSAQYVVQAMGRAKQAIFFSLLRKVIIVIPLTFLLPQIPAVGVDGVFWAEVISNFVGGGACYITMLCTVWRELKHKEMGELAQAKK